VARIAKESITAVILAGGESSRLHYRDKGLLRLNDKPLIRYVIDTVEAMASEVMISANRNQERYQNTTGKLVVGDKIGGFQGPLAGIHQALMTASTPYVLILPCDCPFIEPQVIAGLMDNIGDHDIAVACDARGMQPTFALLRRELAESIRTFLEQGQRKLGLWYQQHRLNKVYFPNSTAFVNINTAADYARHTRINHHNGVPLIQFVGFSGSGKTTLIRQIIDGLSQKGLRLAYLKHSHHDFDMDHPGKDSYECYHAGANQVLISSARRCALVNRYDGEEPDMFALLERLDLDKLDAVVIEGYKYVAGTRKIEVSRSELGKGLMLENDTSIFALVTNDVAGVRTDRLVLDLDDVGEVLGVVERLIVGG
jgi:molybdenum cofactor guanylyltransferase/molybdopterin-guanine dinucleotide biosynthesis protein MobB